MTKDEALEIVTSYRDKIEKIQRICYDMEPKHTK